jgi:hypothetical protein
MPTEIFDPENIFEVAFRFDADMQWTNTLGFEVTKRKVEQKGTIADYIASLPETATVEGKVTAMTVSPALADPQKLVNTSDGLKALAAKKQIVLVLSEIYEGFMAITNIDITKSVEDGHAITCRIGLTRIEQTTAATTQVPASKLRNKVKRKGAPGKKGGAAKGSKPSGPDKTAALNAAQAFGFFR